MARNLDHMLLFWDGSFLSKKKSKWLQIRIKIEFEELNSSKFEEWGISEMKHVIEILSRFDVELSQNRMHMISRDTCFFRWFFKPDFIIANSYRFYVRDAKMFLGIWEINIVKVLWAKLLPWSWMSFEIFELRRLEWAFWWPTVVALLRTSYVIWLKKRYGT